MSVGDLLAAYLVKAASVCVVRVPFSTLNLVTLIVVVCVGDVRGGKVREGRMDDGCVGVGCGGARGVGRYVAEVCGREVEVDGLVGGVDYVEWKGCVRVGLVALCGEACSKRFRCEVYQGIWCISPSHCGSSRVHVPRFLVLVPCSVFFCEGRGWVWYSYSTCGMAWHRVWIRSRFPP